MNTILSSFTASISELKKNPTKLLKSSDGEPIVILNHNVPTAYLLTAEMYEQMLEQLEDAELAKIIKRRLPEKKSAVSVCLDDL